MTDLPASTVTAREHLELRTNAIVARLLSRLDEEEHHSLFHRDDPDEEFPFLADYRRRLGDEAGDRRRGLDHTYWEGRADAVAAGAGRRVPLAVVADAPWGGPTAVDIMVAAALVEDDVRLGAVFAALQAPLNSRRPCLGGLGWLLAERAGELGTTCDRLADAGMVVVENHSEPRAEHIVRLPAPVLAVVEGHPLRVPGCHILTASSAPTLHDLVVPSESRIQLNGVVGLLGQQAVDLIVVRGMSGSGRRTAVRAVAAVHERDVLLSDGVASDPALGAAAALSGAMLAHTVDPALGQLVSLPPVPEGAGPVVAISGRTGGVRLAGGERSLVVDMPPPGPEERRRFWTMADLPADPGVVSLVSDRYVMTGGNILSVADTARAVAAMDAREEVRIDDVRRASQDRSRQLLETFATLLPPLAGLVEPVLGGDAATEFDALVLRCQQRERFLEVAAPAVAAGANRGVRALLSGPSGTGKTLAARALAFRLDLDVYRVDLAAVVDKYIGETERRLNEVLARAEELDVVLLLDEGDALMARRTEVRNSTDRYANLETNYLLQRLETYEGIVVVTTNAANLLDSAFLRRLDVVITLGPPDAASRRQIWALHLPARHRATPEFLDMISTSCALSGGQIRNAALYSTVLALSGGHPVDDSVLAAAIEREYRRAGLTYPLSDSAGEPSVSPLDVVLAAANGWA